MPLALFAALALAADGPADLVWLEGESAVATAPLTVGGWGRVDWLSGRKWLAATGPAPVAGATASWPFHASSVGRYDVWARVGFAGTHSPFRWRVAGRPWVDVPGDTPPHDLGAVDDSTPIAWVKAGSIDLAAGQHTLELNLPGTGGPLRFALDCVCLVGGEFYPDGPRKPGTGRSALDWEAASRGFEFPPAPLGTPPQARRVLELAGTWQAARWDELEVPDRTAPITNLPSDLNARPWRGVRVPGELADARPEWAYCHRFLLRTTFTLPADVGDRSVTFQLPSAALSASVFVNGKRVGVSAAPYAPFVCDLGGVAQPGPNELLVAVKDTFYAVAGTPWKSLRLLPPDRYATSELSRALDWPVRDGRRGGLLETPSLSITGPVFVADVFARPQVSAGRLALEVTVRNPTETPRTVEVKPLVRPTEADGRIIGGSPAKTFAPKSLTVPAYDEATVSFDEPWPNPRIWWPDDPVQYVVETTLTLDGRPVDEQTTRFGFREWGTAGSRVTLNGVPWKLTTSDRTVSPPHAVKDWRARGVSVFRATGERPWTGTSQADSLGFFDAVGMPVLRGGTGGGGTPANRTTQFLARVRAERNSPAVAAWELPAGVDAVAVRAVDPTRPVLPVVVPSPSQREMPDVAYAPAVRPEVVAHSHDRPPDFSDPRTLRMLAEGDRWSGAAVTRLPDGGSAWSPVCVLIREWDEAVSSGQELTRTLKLINDTRIGTPITVHWLFRVRNRPDELRGRSVRKLPPGGSEEFPLSIPMPAGDRLDGELILSCERDGREVFRDRRPLRLYGPPPKLDAPAGAVAVYDPAGKLPGFGGLPRVTDPFALPTECRVLIVGPDAVSATQAIDPRWASLAGEGRRVVVLDQTHPLRSPAVPTDVRPTPHAGRFAVPDDVTHPAFTGVVPEDFACWSHGHTVYRGAYTLPTQGGRPLVSCDDGLENAAVVEVPVGDGLILLSQLAVRDHPTDPVARRVTANLVRYALGYERAAKPTAVLLPDDARRKLLPPLKQVEADGPGTAIQSAQVVVLDATKESLAAVNADAEGLAKFFDGGGWLMAWGVSPESLGEFNRLVGADHLLRPFGAERVTPRPGLSARDLQVDRLFTQVVDLNDVAGFVNATPGRAGWSARLPRRESVSGLSLTTDPDNPSPWARVTFDDKPASAVTVRPKPVAGRQEFAIDPSRPCTRITVEWLPGTTAEVVGLNVVRPGGPVPLAEPGGLVKYPKGAGGVLLCQVRAVDGEPAEATARKRRVVAELLRRAGAGG